MSTPLQKHYCLTVPGSDYFSYEGRWDYAKTPFMKYFEEVDFDKFQDEAEILIYHLDDYFVCAGRDKKVVASSSALVVKAAKLAEEIQDKLDELQELAKAIEEEVMTAPEECFDPPFDEELST